MFSTYVETISTRDSVVLPSDSWRLKDRLLVCVLHTLLELLLASRTIFTSFAFVVCVYIKLLQLLHRFTEIHCARPFVSPNAATGVRCLLLRVASRFTFPSFLSVSREASGDDDIIFEDFARLRLKGEAEAWPSSSDTIRLYETAKRPMFRNAASLTKLIS